MHEDPTKYPSDSLFPVHLYSPLGPSKQTDSDHAVRIHYNPIDGIFVLSEPARELCSLSYKSFGNHGNHVVHV